MLCRCSEDKGRLRKHPYFARARGSWRSTFGLGLSARFAAYTGSGELIFVAPAGRLVPMELLSSLFGGGDGGDGGIDSGGFGKLRIPGRGSAHLLAYDIETK